MAMAENNCTQVKITRNIGKTHSSRSGSGQDCQELIRLQRGATDQTAVDIRHREQLDRIAGLDAADDAQLKDAFYPEIQNAVLGRKSAKAALTDAERAVNRVLSRNS